MSLRKGLALLLLAAFGLTSLVPAGAAVTISASNTTSTTLEAYVLPANSTAGQLLSQVINAADGANEAAKKYEALDLVQVGNGTHNTLADYLTSQGQELVTTLAPAFEGSNQTQNWNLIICETAAAGFANKNDFFFALPSGWDLNLENGAVAMKTVTVPRIFSTISSNGVTLDAVAAGDVQEKTSSLRAGVAIHIAAAGAGTTTGNVRDCAGVMIPHENIIAPTSGSATSANIYLFNGSSTNTTSSVIPAAGTTDTTDLEFAPSILDYGVSLSLANGNDLVNDFIRTGSTLPTGVTTRNQEDRIAAGAIAQTGFTAPSSVTRYRGLADDIDLYGLVINEPDPAAWNLFDGPTIFKPTETLNGTTATSNGSTTKVIVFCENNGTPILEQDATRLAAVPLTDDIDVTSIGFSSNQLEIVVTKRSGALPDPNDVASRILVQGLELNNLIAGDSDTVTNAAVDCTARIQRNLWFNGAAGAGDNGEIFETIAAGESILQNGTTVKALPIWASNGDYSFFNGNNGWALSQGLLPGVLEAFSNTDADTDNGVPFYFSTFSDGTVTVSGAAVVNGTTALKTISSTTEYGYTVEDLPSASSASGDTDKLVTVTIAQNSLTPGLPVTLDSLTTTNDGPSNSVQGAADANGSVTLAIRAKVGQTIRVTAPYLSGGTEAKLDIVVDEDGQTITPAFTSTAITTELDGDDGFVKRGGDTLVVFTVTDANTIGFSFADVYEDAKINGESVFRFGTSNKYGAMPRPGAGSFILTVNVNGTEVTKTIDTTTDYATITPTSFKSHGNVKLKDKRDGKGWFNFKPRRRKFLESVRVFEVNGSGAVTEAAVTLRKRNRRARIVPESDTEFVCITSLRQTDCFDVR